MKGKRATKKEMNRSGERIGEIKRGKERKRKSKGEKIDHSDVKSEGDGKGSQRIYRTK